MVTQHREAMLAAMHDLGGAISDFMAAAPAEEVLRAVREEITTPPATTANDNGSVRHLMLLPSLACQARCSYCFGPNRGPVMRTEVFDAALMRIVIKTLRSARWG